MGRSRFRTGSLSRRAVEDSVCGGFSKGGEVYWRERRGRVRRVMRKGWGRFTRSKRRGIHAGSTARDIPHSLHRETCQRESDF